MENSNKLHVAILATEGFEEVEITEPREALENAGMVTHLISPERDTIKSWDHTDWGRDFDVDVHLDEANSQKYDALFLPGGVLNPDKLRMNGDAIQFIHQFFDAN